MLLDRKINFIIFPIQILIILFTISIPVDTDGAKILFFFAGGTFSHKANVWPFVTALADRGHNVTFVSPFPKRPYDHPTVNDIAPKAMLDAMSTQFINVDRLRQRQNSEENLVWVNYHRDVLKACGAIYSSINKEPQLHRLFHGDQDDLNNQFDVMINNAIFGDCGFVLAHRLMQRGTKLILYDSSYPLSWWADTYGYPSENALIPDGASVQDFPMGFVDRLTNYVTSFYWYLRRQYDLFPGIEAMMKSMYNLTNVPSLIEVERQASLILIASHYSTDYGRSMPPFVVNVGGMQCWQHEGKVLEGEFKEFLDKATNGAIIIAFGSTIDLSRIPDYFKNTFFDMMRRFPELKFIWRWDGPLPPNFPPNLKMVKWLPQLEILGHPNIKAFISHAGLNSVTEATFHGVPLILLPLFADQDYNGYRLQAYEIGIRLEIRTLTLEVMVNAVRDILSNQKYAVNMKKMSAVMRDRPISPIDLAVYHTEFVLRHDDCSAMKPMNDLYLFQRRMWDIFFVLLLCCTLIFLCALIGLRFCISQCRSKLTIDKGDKLTKSQKTKKKSSASSGIKKSNVKNNQKSKKID